MRSKPCGHERTYRKPTNTCLCQLKKGVCRGSFYSHGLSFVISVTQWFSYLIDILWLFKDINGGQYIAKDIVFYRLLDILFYKIHFT